VVVILVDCLRADRVGCYGYERPTTPNIDALAAQSVRFERAYAPAPWSMPSVASLYTGLYPERHGVQRLDQSLPARVATLAEHLRAAGWHTGAILSDFTIGPARSYDRGFAHTSTREARGEGYSSTAGVVSQALDFMREAHAADRPFFLVAHFSDPRPGFVQHPETGFALAPAGEMRGGETLAYLQVMARDMQPEEQAFLQELYDGEVRAVDAGVARLLEELERLELGKRTWVILTSSSGVELMDRGRIGNAHSLHEELVRVPLILRRPHGDGGRVVSAPVSIASVAATVYDLTGAAAADALQAPSLLGILEGKAQPEGPVFFELDSAPTFPLDEAENARLEGLVMPRWKLIRNRDTGELSLFDLVDDPGELRDVAATRPEEVDWLSRELDRHSRATRPAGE
jgi:arylsulfatase A-like enzyme